MGIKDKFKYKGFEFQIDGYRHKGDDLFDWKEIGENESSDGFESLQAAKLDAKKWADAVKESMR